MTKVLYTLRQILPQNFKETIFDTRKNLIYFLPFAVKYQSKSINIYHCCVHKSASQWLQSLLFDFRVYQYSGLKACRNTKIKHGGYLPTESASEKFPEHTIAGSLHISYDNFQKIPKPAHYKAFFVMRDPRDIVVSDYFSLKYSHVPNPGVIETRDKLSTMDEIEGIIYVLNRIHQRRLFTALDSWIDAAKKDPNILLFRFEELTAVDNFAVFKKLLAHCDIAMPDQVLTSLLEEYRFEKLTGRQQGKEDKRSHLRKGIPGDWQNYFNETISSRFQELTGDLVHRLGYG
ncbi:MAG: sulfotransferase domain-containing protein [Gomphosphaeria aponina SAG 52.96 = DSM 107014]|uniref:Sulfotransferase domain-containing protein n=1 Tax=Gomphosphaeria aponina SAG 52.96 = DSM 107014 TaxID=1521640 RepID=A0A941GNG6_9CHRO|nr:sulfotransferase domain-containing protein [Gomphosphaeria aponina SAG 52.96 = DSM 107014]